MLISEPKQILKAAEEAGCESVKIYNQSASAMCDMISDCRFYQVRAVQQYDIDGNDSRRRFLLLSSTPLDTMGVR